MKPEPKAALTHLRLLVLRVEGGDVDAVEACHQNGHDEEIESGSESVDAALLSTRAIGHLTLDSLLLQIRLSWHEGIHYYSRSRLVRALFPLER